MIELPTQRYPTPYLPHQAFREALKGLVNSKSLLSKSSNQDADKGTKAITDWNTLKSTIKAHCRREIAES